MTVSGGYKTLNPVQLGTLVHLLKTRRIGWRAARVFFACAEMLAVREAAARVRRRESRGKGRGMVPHYTREELSRVTGLNARAVRSAVRVLQYQGLLRLAPGALCLPEPAHPEAVESILEASGRRSAHRPIPVPRPLLRFLATLPVAATGKVILGYIVRGLSIARRGGEIRSAGTVKASWLSEFLGLGLRSVRYAQAQLRAAGWIPKDTGSHQRKLNRDGAWFRISLDWQPETHRPIRGATKTLGAPSVSRIAPLTPDHDTRTAPPREDRKTPSESKNQKPGVFENGNSAPPRAPSPPRLSNVVLTDLQDPSRLGQLRRQAVERGWIRDCPADTLNFVAAAIRARTSPCRDPVRVFISLVRERRWSHLTQAHEDAARRLLNPGNATYGHPARDLTRIGAVVAGIRHLIPGVTAPAGDSPGVSRPPPPFSAGRIHFAGKCATMCAGRN